MGRPRKNPEGLPDRVYRKGPSYYYVTPSNRWIWLGKTKAEMFKGLADLHNDQHETAATGLSYVIEEYRKRVLPHKAAKTRKEQTRQLKLLDEVFGSMHPKNIRSVHVAKFHDTLGVSAPSSANRHIALLSHVMRFAIRIGECESNPCPSVQHHKEKPRDRYVTDEEYNAVWSQAPAHIRVIMDLAYLTGQRQGDLVKLKRAQLKEDGIHFKQSKGGRGLIVSWSPNLKAVIKASQELSNVSSMYVICTSAGQPYASSGIQTAWQRLMRRCFKEGVIEERFTFHDLRAKAGTDADDGRLLGHMDSTMLDRVYRRKPQSFNPVK